MYLNQKEFERWGKFYYAPDDPPGGGSGGLSDEAQKAFDNRLKKLEDKGGGAVGLAEQLFGENFQLREKVRVLEGKVSPEGATILTGDDAKAWEDYKALGKPEEVKQGLDQRTKLQGELDTQKREGELRKVADAAKFKYSVLAERDELARVRGKTLTFEVREVERDGKKEPVAYVKDGTTESPLIEYAEKEWADFLPALRVQGGDQQQQTSGTRFISQHGSSSSGGGGGGDVVAAYVAAQAKKAEEAPNPLKKR